MKNLMSYKDSRHPFQRLAGLGIVLACALGQPAFSATEQDGSSSAILMQGFHWNSWTGGWYANMESKAFQIKDLGITHVWFPPPSNSGAREGYLPRELYNLNSAYGSEGQLASAIAALRAQGIQSVADIVINHRVGNYNFADFSNPSWGCESVVNNDEWGGRCGGNDSGAGYGAARDIDHSQLFVQNDIKYFLSSVLKGVGFTGWRFDYSKGYSPYYAKLYVEASQPNFCVGEVWPDLNYDNVDAHRQEHINYVNGTGGQCAAFDFTSKGLLNKVLRDGDYWRLRDSAGRPAGAIGWWAQKMVTFVDNHDTGPSESCGAGQNMWPVPCDKVMLGYAYILSHPGIPSVYYPHVFDWGLKSAIQSLIKARRSVGVTSTSTVSIQKAENGLYAAVVQGSKGKLAVKIGPSDWNPGAGWTLASSGAQYAVWTQDGGVTVPPPSSCSTQVTFQIDQANTAWGDVLYVVGNIPTLGNWTPARGFALTIQGTGAQAVWSGTIDVPSATDFQYKYVKWNGSRGLWESSALTASGNREAKADANCGASQSQLDGPFNP